MRVPGNTAAQSTEATEIWGEIRGEDLAGPWVAEPWATATGLDLRPLLLESAPQAGM